MKKNRPQCINRPSIDLIVRLFIYTGGGQDGSTVAGIPVIALAVGLAFLIQWLVFIPAYLRQTEKFFDITGSLTYITVILLTLFISNQFDAI